LKVWLERAIAKTKCVICGKEAEFACVVNFYIGGSLCEVCLSRLLWNEVKSG